MGQWASGRGLACVTANYPPAAKSICRGVLECSKPHAMVLLLSKADHIDRWAALVTEDDPIADLIAFYATVECGIVRSGKGHR
jgi:hypothetical protein